MRIFLVLLAIAGTSLFLACGDDDDDDGGPTAVGITLQEWSVIPDVDSGPAGSFEFTIENGKLYMLQTRTGKRNGIAAVRMATDMYKEKIIDRDTAIVRVTPNQLVELLLPMLDSKVEQITKSIAKGLPAGPGGAVGRVVFSSVDAVTWAKRGEKVILVREETSPEDVDGMHKAQAVLTTKGGMTSHAALVARGWGKCCIVGCDDIEINHEEGTLRTRSGLVVHEGAADLDALESHWQTYATPPEITLA